MTIVTITGKRRAHHSGAGSIDAAARRRRAASLTRHDRDYPAQGLTIVKQQYPTWVEDNRGDIGSRMMMGNNTREVPSGKPHRLPMEKPALVVTPDRTGKDLPAAPEIPPQPPQRQQP